jgi:hypothetical protein
MYNFRSKNSNPTIYPIKLRGENKQTKTTTPLTSIANLTASERKKCRQNQIAKNRAQYNSSVSDEDQCPSNTRMSSII